MRATFAAVAAIVLVSSASVVRAQEAPAARPAEPAVADDEDSALQERPHIQVLQHPYEISSFYRSSQGSGFDLGYEPSPESEKYPIASFYRSGAHGHYSTFWTTGYGTGYGMRGGMRGGMHGHGFLGPRRVQPLGLNGDLFLFAPFLAPVGPLNGVFLDR